MQLFTANSVEIPGNKTIGSAYIHKHVHCL